jgi:hypothetical protein
MKSGGNAVTGRHPSRTSRGRSIVALARRRGFAAMAGLIEAAGGRP